MAKAYYHPSSAIRICIDKISDTQISGRAFCQQLEKPMIFNDLGILLIKIEDALDQRGYPSSFQKKRNFINETSSDSLSFYKEVSQRKTVPNSSSDIKDDVFGEECTLLVYVLSRRNSSWQGKMEWLDDNSFETFNSALAILRNIDVHMSHKELCLI